VQLAGHLVQEEGQWHAPVALAADAPVGPVGDHVAQPGAAVLGVEAGVVDGVQCGLAQRARCLVHRADANTFVHAHEPLRGGAVDHRRLVAPAVRVAVRHLAGGQQAAGLGQRFDDLRVGLPDVLAAEQRQGGFVDAVALHRVENVVVLETVRHAGVEVFHAIGGRRVHDAGAVFGGGVVGQVDRRDAAIARCASASGWSNSRPASFSPRVVASTLPVRPQRCRQASTRASATMKRPRSVSTSA
jgi:hypothetical protein